jgi:hypothetical protein
MLDPMMQSARMDSYIDQDMLVIEKAPKSWAREIFSDAKLGDRRKTRRLVRIASNTIQSPGASFVANCNGSLAEIEGTYRWMENDSIDHEEIIKAGCRSSSRWLDETEGDILAAADTSNLCYRHSVKEELGPLRHGAKGGTGMRGLLVHSTVFQSVRTGETLGLGDQVYWRRLDSEQGKKHKRKERDYEQKESYKWEFSISRVAERFVEYLKRIIFVLDRESDIYELLMYLIGNDLRYVVRSSWNRTLSDSEKGLFEKISTSPLLGRVLLSVPQKGGRQHRNAKLEIRSCTLTLSPPGGNQSLPPLQLNVVQVKENVASDPISWTLLTSEPVETFEQVLYVLRCYGLRWKVEDFHKIWKTGGTNVEGLRLQSEGAILRAATLLAFVAVRIAQLRDDCDPELLSARTKMVVLSDYTESGTTQKKTKSLKGLAASDRPCTSVLSQLEWQVLWLKVEEGKPIPKRPPNRRWAYQAIGRLVGWYDSKRTGRIGLKTFWKGYCKLQDLTRTVALVQQAGITL